MTAAGRHPFRFAVRAYRATSGDEWRSAARRAEELGYSSLFVSDHYLGDGPVIRAANHRVVTLAAIPAIAVAAEATTTLRDLCKTGSSNLTGMGFWPVTWRVLLTVAVSDGRLVPRVQEMRTRLR
jgi:hypothetical protein